MNIKIRFLGNMFVFITTFQKMVVKFIGGCSVATCSYMIIHSMSKIYSFPVYVVLPLQELHDKKYKTLVLWQLLWHLIFQLYPFDFMKFEHSCIHEAHKLQRESLHSQRYKPCFSEIQFWTFGLFSKHNKILGCFKACITLHLSNTFFNLLSFTLLNNELAVMEIIFKSKCYNVLKQTE